MARDHVLLNNGDDLLRNDGVFFVLLNTATDTTGVILAGEHGKIPLVHQRGEQLIDVEFTFWLQATIIQKVVEKFRLQASILREIIGRVRVKSTLLIEHQVPFKIKSALLLRERYDVRLKASLLEKYVFKLVAETNNKRLKKALLKKLMEYLKDED